MSLFKAREWWSTNSGFEEFHDSGCLCVANIDNDSAGYDKIVVGSFQGLVRIYEPHPPTFAPYHVIFEKQLGHPVIQLGVGQFVHGSTLLHLAVLHSHLLAVYAVVLETSSDFERTYNLVMNFSHRLKRTAYNMTWGHFGKLSCSDDLLAVQSMDGQLSFFHHDTPTFTCFLPNFLVPGPVAYICQSDSLVTVNSAHMLQVFKYQSLSVAGSGSEADNVESAPNVSSSTGKRISPDWAVNLGEGALEMQVVSVGAGSSHILVLGERNLFCLSQNAVVEFTMKLDCSPSCLYAYSASAAGGPEGLGTIKTLLSSHANQLLVLQDSCLIWAACMDHTPIQISTANFQEQTGIIVTLDEQGRVVCSYLGTDPTVFSAPQSSSRDVVFEKMEEELSQLNHVIRESAKEGMSVGTGQVQVGTLKLWAEIDSDQVRILELEEGVSEGDGGEVTDGNYTPIKKCLEVKVHIKAVGGPTVRDVTLSITASLPLTTHPAHFVLPEVGSAQQHVVTVVCTPSLLPCTNNLHFSATYLASDGSQQVLEHEIKLPLQLFCEPIYPQKNATFKVTIDATPCEPVLSKLFPSQLVLDHAPPQALGLRYICGPIVTVVASKGTQRYRMHSDSLPALGCTLKWLLGSLEKHFKLQGSSFTAKFAPPLPLNEYFEILDRHFKLRLNLEQCREWLERHAHQFRSIQKRLLTRFKDKTPVGLAHLDTLLDGTYMQLMALSDKSELLQLELQECSNQLSCATALINTLLKLCSDMTADDFAVLCAALTPHGTADGDQGAGPGWEELVDAAVTHLLRTSLAKSSKDQQQQVSLSPSLEMPKDTHKLKKHLALLCDRISKGFLPSGKQSVEATQSLIDQDQTTGAEETVPRVGDRRAVSGFSTAIADDGGSIAASYRKHSLSTARQPTMPVLPEHSAEENMM